MEKLRIVERKHADGQIWVCVEKKRFLLGWSSADLWEDWPIDKFTSLEEAEKNLYRWDGTPSFVETVAWP